MSKRTALYSSAIILILIGFVCVVVFGNPQWNRWIYILQSAVGPVDRPSDFTGTWRTWYANGQLKAQGDFIDGNLGDGGRFDYDTEGKLQGIEFGASAFITFDYNQTEMTLGHLTYYLNDKENVEVIYDLKNGIDRRSEFGIQVE